jgi:FkbM family methyltransferase
MKKLVKKILSWLFDPIAFCLGYRKIETSKQQAIPILIDKYGKNNLLETFYTLLKSLDFEPKHIVDVGANHGTWTREALKYFPKAYYTLLEPQAHLQSSIKDIMESNNKVTFHAVGAGSKPGKFKFTVFERDDSCTFRLSEEEAKIKGYQQLEISVVPLNEFLPTANKVIPDIIKIDAEGLDLEVLAGATDYFGITEIFMVEAGVMARNIKNSAAAVIQYMDKNGYRLFDITEINRAPKYNALWLVELVFIKNNGRIDNLIINYN